MKLTFIIVGAPVLIILIGLAALSRQSQTPPTLGLINGQFQPCIYTTNCVNSMSNDESFIAPFAGDVNAKWLQLSQVVKSIGGEIQQQTDSYLRATFESKWMGFVDDLELALDTHDNVIHVRSSSRVGRSDFGANRKRVEQLRELL